MLQKMGWKEGHGLGSLGKGIREPVSVYGAPGDSGCFLLGLGTVYSWVIRVYRCGRLLPLDLWTASWL